jgi:hypothetical protein
MSSKLLLAGAVVLFLGLGVGTPARRPASQQRTRQVAAEPRIDFDTQIRPILERRCQPCHFAGGKMYTRLPFDRPETIRSLGEKMFTRIKDEQEQALLRAFLAQAASSSPAK